MLIGEPKASVPTRPVEEENDNDSCGKDSR
jgi:hypothetical protein